jgi:microcompartment protein CcmL/EutN
MKQYPAIAILEFRDISVGLFATDAMVKKAPIAVLKSGTISQGRFLTLVGGTTASVEESYEAGLELGGDSILDNVFLPDVHPAVHDGILGNRSKEDWTGALGIIETNTVACNVMAAEKAMKATDLGLLELRLSDSWLAGKGISI